MLRDLMLFYLFVYSILQKASTALEVLKEVLDAVDSQNPEVDNIRIVNSIKQTFFGFLFDLLA